MNRRDLYPDIKPYRQGTLAVDPPHVLYWEESGNPNGVPVVFLHGGPGAGATAGHRRFFDPSYYRIIIFDQRGAGRSKPLGSLETNTTGHLVSDIEALRRYLEIETWFVFGGSWGASLALAYAQAHADRCRGLILRGIFLCRAREVDWFMTGMRRVFPEIWRKFQQFLPEAERGDLLTHYHRRLVDPDPRVHMAAAKVWSQYEGACSTLLPSPDSVAAFAAPDKALGLARIEAHYFMNASFMDEGQLLAKADSLKNIPGVIVQGRYDMVCPLESADALAAAWPAARYTIVPDAGHSAMEPGIRRALVDAMERFKT
ncbi:MAG: prolyl aminopeptidase [Rhodospirillaceae bacterium]|jgi:proline iminopeptidase|nr:prolyl aminopeptidase [Rhodospirillaceae bacterium]MBT5664777.1 prolyl aminopeptidase [Rhodospirillaceae bacterium]MBT5809908.1 prolyl aminopeptidase [Rhodospirillaceae bacterium]